MRKVARMAWKNVNGAPPLVVAAVALLVSILLSGAARGGESMGEASLVGKEIAGATLTDSGGNTFLVPARDKGKVDVVNFWGIRCGSCLEELPKLEELYVKFKSKGLSVYGINADAVSWDVLAPLVRKMNINVTFPLITDKELDLMDAYQVMATPMTVVMDERGIVRYQHVGYANGDEKKIEDAITRLMEPGR